ncbi:unnamed protein product [Peronospora belbahrii]|uniref:Uncharacterized protein n=1 Tax=Peronospora belbahrii TaxID=622444 RepID=A0AAU9KLT9_9STRA|nr:unnamed protein product [Peronospora belbahrii]CAH0514153.1 unnamed protein product [Peronospora belbahrii]
MIATSFHSQSESRLNTFLQKFHRSSTLLKPFFGHETTSGNNITPHGPCSTTTTTTATTTTSQSRFRRASKSVQKAFVLPATTKPVCKSAETLTPSRKRDRLRYYLAHRRENNKTNQAVPYLWPTILSTDQEESSPTDKEETSPTDETEDGDDVYMVDWQSDSDSDLDDELRLEQDTMVLPVSIPEVYRRQDWAGGAIVAGARVLFTYDGFKRQQTMLHKLQSVPEGNQLTMPLGLHHEHIVIGAF